MSPSLSLKRIETKRKRVTEGVLLQNLVWIIC